MNPDLRPLDVEFVPQSNTERPEITDPTVIVVADNASFHHAKFITHNICIQDKIDLKFLPPYSPYVQPVELAFSLIKWSVQKVRHLETDAQLENAIVAAVKQLHSSMVCETLFKHCITYFEALSEGMPLYVDVPTAGEINLWKQFCGANKITNDTNDKNTFADKDQVNLFTHMLPVQSTMETNHCMCKLRLSINV